MSRPLDATDWAILIQLQDDARLSLRELARRVHLSAPSVSDRLRRLEETGVLTGYRATVDLGAAGRGVVAYVRLSCYGPRCVLRDPDVAGWPEVLELHRVTGDACSLLKVGTATMADFEALVDRLAVFGPPSSTMVLASPLPAAPLRPLPEVSP